MALADAVTPKAWAMGFLEARSRWLLVLVTRQVVLRSDREVPTLVFEVAVNRQRVAPTPELWEPNEGWFENVAAWEC